mgnify:CR=1 FL=1
MCVDLEEKNKRLESLKDFVVLLKMFKCVLPNNLWKIRQQKKILANNFKFGYCEKIENSFIIIYC